MTAKKEDSFADKVITGAVFSLSGIGPLVAIADLLSGSKPTISKVGSAAGLLDTDAPDVSDTKK